MEHNFAKMVEISTLLNDLQMKVQEFDRLRDYVSPMALCESQRLKCNETCKLLTISIIRLQHALKCQVVEYQHVMDV